MTGPPPYSFTASLKSALSDEPVNTFLIRPVAGVLVRALYPLPVSPNQVTVCAIVAGVFAAAAFLQDGFFWSVLGGVLLVVKDVLDSADGQLARSRGTGSRAGRFLDSIGDLLVNVLVFGAIADRLYAGGAPAVIFAVAAAALLCTTVRVSFHAFFQTSYLHLSGQYRNNRITEDIAPEDLSREDPLTLFLHRVFLILYGWQDRLIERIDRWMLGGRELRGPDASAWYGDRIGLRLGGFLGLGTELMVLSLCAVTGSLELYFALNLILLNMVLAAAAGYRLFILAPRIARLFSA